MAFNMIHTTPATAPIAVFQLLTMWLAAGCTVTKSGDGLAAFSNSGNVLTSGGTGAGGLGNARAWFVVAWGDGEEWCIQRGATADQYWRIKVARASSFTGGAPSATLVPTAPDEVLLANNVGGTDASPGGLILFQTNGSYYLSAGIDTASPRRMWVECYAVAGSALNTWLWRDVLVPTEATDADPYVRGIAWSSGLSVTTIMNATSGDATSTPYYMGFVPSATPTTVVHMPFSQPSVNNQPFYGNSGTLSISGSDPLAVLRYQRQAAQGAPLLIKGDSTLFAICGPTRANGDRFTVASANDRVAFSMITTPWDNTVVQL